MSAPDWQDFLHKYATDIDLTPAERETLICLYPSPHRTRTLKEMMRELNVAKSTLQTVRLQNIYEKSQSKGGCVRLNGLVRGVHKSDILLECLNERYKRQKKQSPVGEVTNGLQSPNGAIDIKVNKIADLLTCFDYQPQANHFENLLHEGQAPRAFLVRAEDKSVQRWLVERLIPLIPGFDIGHKILIDIQRLRIRSNYSLLWEELGSEIGVETPISRETVLKSLCKIAVNRKIILIFQGLQKLSKEQRSDLHDFWMGLVEAVAKQNISSKRRGLLLLVVGNSLDRAAADLRPFEFIAVRDSSDIPGSIALEDLVEIDPKQIQSWLNRHYSKVCKEILPGSSLLRETDMENYIEQVKCWERDPWTVLDRICEDLGCEEGINTIERYWRSVA